MSNRLKGIVMAAGSAGLWGLMGLFTRTLNRADYSALDIAYLRCLITALGLFLLFAIRSPQVLKTDRKGVFISLVFGALTYSLGFLSHAVSVQRIPVAMTAVLTFMNPVWVCLVGRFLFKDRVKASQVFSILCCLLGAVLITDLLGGTLHFDLLGIAAGVINGVGIAAQVLVPRYFCGRYQRDTMMAYGFLGAALAMLPFAHHSHILHSFTAPGGGQVLFSLLFLSIPCTLVANTCFVNSTAYVKPATTSILSALEVVVGTVVGFLFFHEALTALQFLGAVLIVGASLGMELVTSKKCPQRMADDSKGAKQA